MSGAAARAARADAICGANPATRKARVDQVLERVEGDVRSRGEVVGHLVERRRDVPVPFGTGAAPLPYHDAVDLDACGLRLEVHLRQMTSC